MVLNDKMNFGALRTYTLFMSAYFSLNAIGNPSTWQFLAPASIFFGIWADKFFFKSKMGENTAMINYNWAVSLAMAIESQRGNFTKITDVWMWTYHVLFAIIFLNQFIRNLKN